MTVPHGDVTQLGVVVVVGMHQVAAVDAQRRHVQQQHGAGVLERLHVLQSRHVEHAQVVAVVGRDDRVRVVAYQELLDAVALLPVQIFHALSLQRLLVLVAPLAGGVRLGAPVPGRHLGGGASRYRARVVGDGEQGHAAEDTVAHTGVRAASLHRPEVVLDAARHVTGGQTPDDEMVAVVGDAHETVVVQ